jgi:general secretion pathway protein K
MVLVLTTVLGALAADIQNETSVNLQLAANARDQLQAEFHAKSAVELELFFLRFQSQLKSVIGNYVPIPLFELSTFFVSSDTMKGILDRDGKKTPSDEQVKESYASDLPFGDFKGSFWIEEVIDENRKININKPPATACQNMVHILLAGLFDGERYDPLFELTGESRDPIRNRIDLIANITDWVDGNNEIDTVCTLTGDNSLSGGPEESRYNNLPYNATYEPKNAQMTSLAELRMVPGVNDAFMQLFGEHLTIWTDDSAVNLNTAGPAMLEAVVRAIVTGGVQPGQREQLRDFMQELQLQKALPPPLNKVSKPVFLQLLQKAGFAVDEARFNQLESAGVIRFDDTSNVYRVTAVGRVGEATSTITVVWRDNRAQGEIRYWREE